MAHNNVSTISNEADISEQISDNAISDLKLIAFTEYVMFGSYRCPLKVVELDGDAVRLEDIVLDDKRELSRVDIPMVQIDAIDYREHQHSHPYLTIKPNKQFYQLNRFCEIDSNLESGKHERLIVIVIKEWRNNCNVSYDQIQKCMAFMRVKEYFSQIKNVKICKQIVAVHESMRDESDTNARDCEESREDKLLEEVKRLREELQAFKRKQISRSNLNTIVCLNSDVRSGTYNIINEKLAPYLGYVETILIFKIEKFSQLCGALQSPSAVARNYAWNIMALPRIRDTTGVKSLAFFLQCKGDAYRQDWACDVSAELRIISQREGRQSFGRKIRHKFCRKEYDWGYSAYLEWETIVDPINGYIKDDSVILEVWFLI